MMLEIVTNPMAIHSFFEMLSLKTASATSEVATISKLLRSETFAAVADLSPNIKRIGAKISRATIAAV